MWKTIKQIPKLEINEYGIVRDKATLGIRKLYKTTNNYMQLRVQQSNIKYYYYVHRLVYEAFIGEIPKDKEINHIDGDPTNNNINNLELCTHQQNCLHRSKLSNHSTKAIKVILKTGKELNFNSRKECAAYFKVDESTIRDYIKSKCSKRRKVQGEFYYI